MALSDIVKGDIYCEIEYIDKYYKFIKNELINPSPELIKFFAKKVYDGKITPKILQEFTSLTEYSISNAIDSIAADRIKDMFKSMDEAREAEKAKEDSIFNFNKNPFKVGDIITDKPMHLNKMEVIAIDGKKVTAKIIGDKNIKCSGYFYLYEKVEE